MEKRAGWLMPGPRALRSSLARLRRASRAHSRKSAGSANRRKSAARLARIHARVANVRADALHQATSGLVTGRDVNAAANLLNLAASGAESLNACGGTIRPGLAGHVPANQEPGAAQAGQTGTASGQPLAVEQELTDAH